LFRALHPFRSRRLAVLSAAVALGATACSGPPEEPPDVVLVVLDTLRPDRLGLGGAPADPAPFLGALARTGATFPRAVSTSSWTAPSTASLLTGLYPTQHGVVSGMFARQRMGMEQMELNRFPESLETCAETLRRHGYRTFGVASNYNIGPEIGFDRGFDRFVRLENVPLGDRVRVGHRGDADEDTTATHVSADAGVALEQLEAWREDLEAGGPRFLYLHLNDVHRPYIVQEPWHRPRPDAEPLAAYDSEIAHMDHVLSRIWRGFGLAESTIVAVVSDHGEAFGEHGYSGHSRGLDAEVQRIVFIFHGPGVRPGLHPEIVSLVDVLPTLLELAGLAPADQPVAGTSLVPLIRGDERRPELSDHLEARLVFGHKETFNDRIPDFWSVQVGSWKAVQVVGKWRLFDLARDPGETRDVSAEHPELLERLKAEAERFAARGAFAAGDTVRVELDDESVDILRSLGYAD
jgi:arylsulfatase A-like enzyme